LAGATVAEGRVVVDGGLEPQPEVEVRVGRVNHLLNTDLDAATIAGYLSPIGFEVLASDDATLTVRIPSWRPDSTAEIDVVEEIGRHHGYEKSGTRVPTSSQTGRLSDEQVARRRIRRAFLAAGFSEAMPLPFLAPNDLVEAGLDDHAISLANPLVHEESILRTSLLPGLLKSVAYNQSHRNTGAKLYELGQIFLPSDDELPDEQHWVAAIWDGVDATEIVRVLHGLARSLRLTGMKLQNTSLPGLHPTRAAQIQFRGRPLGGVGEVDPSVLERKGISGRVAYLEMQVDPITAALSGTVKYKPVSKYPSSDVDLAFVVPDSVPASDVLATITKSAPALVTSVELFDVFRSDALGSDARSLAYRLRFQADDHTLTDEEVNAARVTIVSAVQKHHRATLR
jgi:phenylalanyl-tRNA synthetase beta chain